MADRVRAKVVDILEHHEPLLLQDETEAALEKIVTEAEARHAP